MNYKKENKMKTIEVVCAVIKDAQGRTFSCKRGPGRANEGKWEFPGGKIESNETREQSLVREIKEELKTDIKVIKYITTVEHTYPDMPPYKGFHIIMHAFECELIKGNLELTEHTNKGWFTKEEMEQMPFAEADKPIVKII